MYHNKDIPTCTMFNNKDIPICTMYHNENTEQFIMRFRDSCTLTDVGTRGIREGHFQDKVSRSNSGIQLSIKDGSSPCETSIWN